MNDRYLVNKIKSEKQHRFHLFNSFFFIKLTAAFEDPSGALDGRDNYQSAHRWIKDVNIFEKDYIFLPINSR